jgi:DNA-directed RNA polymerase specialized sigma24 family protein
MGDENSRREDLTLGRDAFLSRVDAVMDPSYRLATVMLLDYAAAEDAVHRAALRAWRLYRRLRGDVTNFRTWFLALVVDECRRTIRRRALLLRRGGGAPGRSTGLSEAIRRLPAGTRAALFCFFFLDLPLDEVARVLRVSPARVRSRVYRAGERLQPALVQNVSEPS